MLKKGCHFPFGRRRETATSGTKTPSSMMSWEPVARMAMVRQVSSTRTPSAFMGTGKCSTVGPSEGSS